jgi:uncharacterized damage-inducible protein DinB
LDHASQARQMASYDRWMNERLYQAAATLPDAVPAAGLPVLVPREAA